MRSEGYCTWFVCVSVCLSDALFLKHGKFTHLKEGTNGYGAHCPGYYKKGFHDRRFIQELWCHLLTGDILRGYCSAISRTFLTAEPSKGPKKANNRLNATWNTTQCEAASFFSLSRSCLSLPHTFCYT